MYTDNVTDKNKNEKRWTDKELYTKHNIEKQNIWIKRTLLNTGDGLMFSRKKRIYSTTYGIRYFECVSTNSMISKFGRSYSWKRETRFWL